MVDIPTRAFNNTADFSDCNYYRYTLIRDYGKGEGRINFIMLNPSTANEQFNDPTVARCEQRAINGGYRRMVITNIFAFRATDPKEMMQALDPVGERNDQAIIEQACLADTVICAWGEMAKHQQRGAAVRSLLANNRIKAHALKINRSGEPAHPLYLSFKLEPIPYFYEAANASKVASHA